MIISSNRAGKILTIMLQSFCQMEFNYFWSKNNCFFTSANFSKILNNLHRNLFLTRRSGLFELERQNKNQGRQSSHNANETCYTCLIFLTWPCFRVKVDIFKVSGALIFQKLQKITWKFIYNLQFWHI